MLSILRVVGGLVLLGLLHVVGSFVYQIIYYRFFHPLSKYPGPFWGSVTRLWITYHNIKGDEPETFQALHRKYGMSVCFCQTWEVSVLNRTRTLRNRVRQADIVATH
jgi:hypothetical protein